MGLGGLISIRVLLGELLLPLSLEPEYKVMIYSDVPAHIYTCKSPVTPPQLYLVSCKSLIPPRSPIRAQPRLVRLLRLGTRNPCLLPTHSLKVQSFPRRQDLAPRHLRQIQRVRGYMESQSVAQGPRLRRLVQRARLCNRLPLILVLARHPWLTRFWGLEDAFSCLG